MDRITFRTITIGCVFAIAFSGTAIFSYKAGRQMGQRRGELDQLTSHASHCAVEMGCLRRANYDDIEHFDILERSLDLLIFEISTRSSYAAMNATDRHRMAFVKGYRTEYPFDPAIDDAKGMSWNSTIHRKAIEYLRSINESQKHRYSHEKVLRAEMLPSKLMP